jgi:hypothetical protein
LPILWLVSAAQPGQGPVEQNRRQFFGHRYVSLPSPGDHHVEISVQRRLVKPRNVLRPVLEIAVHHHDPVAERMVDPGGDGRMLTEIARKPYGSNPPVASPRFVDPRPGAVGRAVVDQNDFVALGDRGERRAEPADQFVDELSPS